MEKLMEVFKSYLSNILDVRIKIRSWKQKDTFPFFLVDAYDFYEALLFKQPCLLMVAKDGVEQTPGAVKKHWEQVQKKWPGLCIFVQRTMTSYNRKRLIEHRVPFVIPGHQMYVPDLGIDLREHFRELRANKKSFSPATQAVVIYALRHEIGEGLMPSEMAPKLGYTLMTMTRAFDELEAAEIGEVRRKGKERWWSFKGDRHDLWKQAMLWMRSPVRKRAWLKGKKPKYQAGLSALEQLSMLNAPAIPIYAISMEEWKKLSASGVQEFPTSEDAAFELEIWNYDPGLFAEGGFVDPFSLYMSLHEKEDERIEKVLEEMMEKMKW